MQDRTVQPANDFIRPRRLLSYQVGNMQNQGGREYQEDSFCFVNATDVTEIKTQGLLALLADGMGGLEDGKAVSETALQLLREEFLAMDRGGNLAEQLMTAVRRTDESLFYRFSGRGGTTLVACLIYREKLWFACVGDSYLYLQREGELTRLNAEQNQCHTQYAEQIVQGNLDPRAANEADGAQRLSEFMGSGQIGEMDASRRPLILRAGDQLLLCSDGVGGVLNQQELCDCLAKPTPMQACQEIEREIVCRNRAYQDNFTAMVIRCGY